MKKLLTTMITAFVLSGCSTTVSIRVDAEPVATPEELSKQISKQYPQIGINPDSGQWLSPSSFKLGRWGWFENRCGGFVGHDLAEGMLEIWIAPSPKCDGAPEISKKILKLLSETAPSALVHVHESRGLDLR